MIGDVYKNLSHKKVIRGNVPSRDGGPGESRGGGLEHRTFFFVFFLSESTVRSGSVNKSVWNRRQQFGTLDIYLMPDFQ